MDEQENVSEVAENEAVLTEESAPAESALPEAAPVAESEAPAEPTRE